MGKLERLQANGYDLSFLVKTQPVGNIKQYDGALRIGNMWTSSLYVYHLIEEPHQFWMVPFSELGESLLTIDIGTRNPEQVKAELDRALSSAFRGMSHTNILSRELSKEDYLAIKSLAISVAKKFDVMKYIKIRVHICAETQDELDKKLNDMRKKLSNERFGVTVCLMEQQEEYLSRFLDYNTQNYLPNRRAGNDIATTEFGYSLPLNYVYLADKRGDYLGWTRTAGNFIFDRFTIDGAHRTHYNMFVVGKMGTGKSTLLKKMFQDDARKGYLIYGFDKSGEYTQLINYWNGLNIRLDGQDGRINIFEIFPTMVLPNGDVDEQGSYTSQVARLKSWYGMISQTTKISEIKEFSLLVSQFYERKGFVDETGTIIRQKVTGLPVTEYPILSEFLDFILSLQPINDKQASVWYDITTHLTELLKTNKRLFDGHTSVPNFADEQIVFFNIDGLSSLSAEVRSAQLFSAVTLLYSMLVRNGRRQMQRYKRKEEAWDFLVRGTLYIDECHNILNFNNLHLVEYITTFMREARKLLISIVLSTQSLNQFVSENFTQEQQQSLKEVFEFCQYVVYFYMKSNVIPLLKIISSGQLNDYQLERIGKQNQGEFLMTFDGGTSYEVKMDVTTQELQLFDGGGRTHEEDND